jgi:hypothetical protein
MSDTQAFILAFAIIGSATMLAVVGDRIARALEALQDMQAHKPGRRTENS